PVPTQFCSYTLIIPLIAPRSFSFHRSHHPHAPHSFPTRRSSDLPSHRRVVPAVLVAQPGARIQLVTVRRPRARTAPRSTRTSWIDRKSTRLNSSHGSISYAVFCLKKKNKT